MDVNIVFDAFIRLTSRPIKRSILPGIKFSSNQLLCRPVEIP